MEIILLASVRNLGDKDDIVNVKPGFANNYLIPQLLAVQATKSNKKMVEENVRQASHRQEKIKDEARQLAAQLQSLTLKVSTLVGKEGKIFGSVTAIQIGNLFKENGFDIDRRKITIPEEIKVIGEYIATVALHKEVKAEVKFEVVERQGE